MLGEAVMSKRSAKFKIIFGLALLFLIVTRTSLAQVPQVPHVLIVVEENTDYAEQYQHAVFVWPVEPG